MAAVHARQEGAVGAFIAELRRRQVPDTIRSAVLEPDHALCKRLDDLMIDLAGNYVHGKNEPLQFRMTVTFWRARNVAI